MHKYLNILRTITIFATMMLKQESIVSNIFIDRLQKI